MKIAGCFFVWTDRRTDGQTVADTNKGVVEVQAIRLRTNSILYFQLFIKKRLLNWVSETGKMILDIYNRVSRIQAQRA